MFKAFNNKEEKHSIQFDKCNNNSLKILFDNKNDKNTSNNFSNLNNNQNSFGNNINNNIFNIIKKEDENKLFLTPINNKNNGRITNNINLFNADNNEKKKAKNNSVESQKKKNKKCSHNKYFTSYCISEKEDISHLMCYECLYRYHKKGISKCIPIKMDYFEKYKKYYKELISEYKNNIKIKFEKIIDILDDYENEEIKDISSLFEDKLDLNFELPIEIPFIERFKIATNRKLSKVLDNQYESLKINFLNLFENNLKDLKAEENNPNDSETVIFKSSVDFNLLGIGIPKTSEKEKEKLEIEIYKENYLLKEEIKYSENEDLFLTLIMFDYPIKIVKNMEYSIKMNFIEGFNYIANEENYNIDSKIEINSDNNETILCCFIIE